MSQSQDVEASGSRKLSSEEIPKRATVSVSKKIPVARSQQFKKAVRVSAKRMGRFEKDADEDSDESDEDSVVCEDSDPEYEEDEEDGDNEDVDDEEDDDEEEEDDSEEEKKIISKLEKRIQQEKTSVQKASAVAVAQADLPTKTVKARKSLGSVGRQSTSGSLGSVSSIPKKRGRPSKKTYAEGSEEEEVKKDGPKLKRKRQEPVKKTCAQSAQQKMDKKKQPKITGDLVTMDVSDVVTKRHLQPFECHIGNNVFVKIQEFYSTWYFILRKYDDEGKPNTNRGINLNVDNIGKIKKAVDAAYEHVNSACH